MREEKVSWEGERRGDERGESKRRGEKVWRKRRGEGRRNGGKERGVIKGEGIEGGKGRREKV